AVFDASGAILGREHRATGAARGADAVIEDVAQCIESACAQAKVAVADTAGIGIATAGAIDAPNGVVLMAPNLRWEHFPLRERMRERLNHRVVIENDVNAAVWGEYQRGAATGAKDVLGVWVGTGVGGGLVLGGRLHHGDFFTAGEIGHTIIRPDADPHFRTVEDVASRTGMSRIVHRLRAEHPDTVLPAAADGSIMTIHNHVLAEALAAGDALAKRVVDDAAELLGIAIANWVTALSLSRVVIGGGVTEALGASYLSQIRAAFDADVFPDRCRACELVMTSLADTSGLVGAALLAT
ncbi:MAG: ROK family protein, partial [Phycisphaerales bacterium]|nr:ROK family protein [Phycisphaerales bacterium]